jgi:uncharacterized protein YecT (DUF1311 family)
MTKNNIMKKLLKLFLIGILTGATAAAADNCERPRNTFDSLYCARKIFFTLDDDLNRYYRLLREQLDAAGTARLKQGQLAWIRDRDSQCTRDNAVIVACAVDRTRERLHFLQERYRECQSVGCMPDRL